MMAQFLPARVRPLILIVEEDGDLRDLLAAYFEHDNCDTVTAADGLTALRAMETTPPDAVVLELNLPVLSGFRLLHLLRRDPALAHVPVLVATVYSVQEVRDVFPLGVQAFFQKPFDPKALLRETRRCLSDGHGRDVDGLAA